MIHRTYSNSHILYQQQNFSDRLIEIKQHFIVILFFIPTCRMNSLAYDREMLSVEALKTYWMCTNKKAVWRPKKSRLKIFSAGFFSRLKKSRLNQPAEKKPPDFQPAEKAGWKKNHGRKQVSPMFCVCVVRSGRVPRVEEGRGLPGLDEHQNWHVGLLAFRSVM